jgi:hypothetical protein
MKRRPAAIFSLLFMPPMASLSVSLKVELRAKVTAAAPILLKTVPGKRWFGKTQGRLSFLISDKFARRLRLSIPFRKPFATVDF